MVLTNVGGQILATDAIRAAYHDGRGSIPMRGKVIIEGDTADSGSGSNGNGSTSNRAGKGSKGKTQRKRSGEGKPAVVITELPYQTNKVCTNLECLLRLQRRAGSLSGSYQQSEQLCPQRWCDWLTLRSSLHCHRVNGLLNHMGTHGHMGAGQSRPEDVLHSLRDLETG